jgi:hypothetical protein
MLRLSPTDHEMIPFRAPIYAHAQDFVTNDEMLLPFLQTFALPSWSCFLFFNTIYLNFSLKTLKWRRFALIAFTANLLAMVSITVIGLYCRAPSFCTSGHRLVIWRQHNPYHNFIMFFQPAAVDKTDARRPYVIEVIKLARALVRWRTVLLSQPTEFSDANCLHREECVGKNTDLRLFDPVVPHPSLFSCFFLLTVVIKDGVRR